MTTDCICWDGNPANYEGPQVDCPKHGVRNMKPIVSRVGDSWWLSYWGYDEDGPNDPLRADPRQRSFQTSRFDTWLGAHASLARRIRRGWVVCDG